MRNNCPVCLGTNRESTWEMDFVVPDGWRLPAKNLICYCRSCGMIWHDNDCTQADYDWYYRTKYGFDGAADPFWHVSRWESDLKIITEFYRKDAHVVDFGGGCGYITKRLRALGYKNVSLVEVGDPLPDNTDLVLAIHVFEHLYDVRGVLDNLISRTARNGSFFVEVPDAKTYINYSNLPLIDYHQVHINHFAKATLDNLFCLHGYKTAWSEAGQLPGSEASMYRAIYSPKDDLLDYRRDKKHVLNAVNERLDKLKQVDSPVILWGCGAYAMHMLARCPEVAARIVYFVDIDPAFRGETILDKPVYGRVQDGDSYPILVIAQQQATGILKNIQDLGLKNEVIQI